MDDLRAVWDVPGQPAAGGGGGASGYSAQAGPSSAGAQGAQSQARERTQTERARNREDEDPEDRAQRRRDEGREDLTRKLLEGQDLETIGEAFEYCARLVDTQVERATDAQAPLNTAIYGDVQTRRAVMTLLPDAFIRELFLRTTRKQQAWGRLRSLFGTPPYNFLRPEDAGLVRAAGIAAGRSNMAYERANETAEYSQFGEGHFEDEYAREYRVVPVTPPRGADSLPYDLENISPSAYVYMNVRVPKRSKQEKVELMKDIKKRKAVVFPAVGEQLVIRYSAGLRNVWRSEKSATAEKARIVVKSMTPRSANAATAALVAVRV